MTEIRAPEDLWGEEAFEGVLAAWLYDDGDQVQQGAVIAQIMVEKVQLDLESPASGVLRIEIAQEAPIRKGDLIARVE